MAVFGCCWPWRDPLSGLVFVRAFRGRDRWQIKTCSPRPSACLFCGEYLCRRQRGGPGFIERLELFTRCSPRPGGEQAVSNNSLSGGRNLLCWLQFIEREAKLPSCLDMDTLLRRQLAEDPRTFATGKHPPSYPTMIQTGAASDFRNVWRILNPNRLIQNVQTPGGGVARRPCLAWTLNACDLTAGRFMIGGAE